MVEGLLHASSPPRSLLVVVGYVNALVLAWYILSAL